MRLLSIILFASTFFLIKSDARANNYSKESTNKVMDECILNGIKKASKNYHWVSARGIRKSCACMANNYVMGLNTESCDKTTPIRDRDVKEYFEVK